MDLDDLSDEEMAELDEPINAYNQEGNEFGLTPDEADFEEVADIEDRTEDLYNARNREEANKLAFGGINPYDLDSEDDYVPYDDFDIYDSRIRHGRPMNEMVLNDFGKHPAYQKKVMTLPPNVEIDRFGRDWNDKSAKGDKPYGTKIGSSYPYTEKLVDQITDAVMNEMYNKKKI